MLFWVKAMKMARSEFAMVLVTLKLKTELH